MAVPGIWPLLFPPLGYNGQLSWLEDTAACMSKRAYTALLAASKEGRVELPKYLTIKLVTGHTVYLGPNLTIPTTANLKRTPNIQLLQYKYTCVATHKQVKKEEERARQWDDELPIDESDNIIQRVEEDIEYQLPRNEPSIFADKELADQHEEDEKKMKHLKS